MWSGSIWSGNVIMIDLQYFTLIQQFASLETALLLNKTIEQTNLWLASRAFEVQTLATLVLGEELQVIQSWRFRMNSTQVDIYVIFKYIYMYLFPIYLMCKIVSKLDSNCFRLVSSYNVFHIFIKHKRWLTLYCP